MLLSLHLRDFVIVDQLDLEFGPGFNVLSGETGAGKSILLDALQLALGGRADSSVVREGCARTDITAIFRCPANLSVWLDEHALTGDEGLVQLRRLIDADGKSRALINGQPSTASLQRELGEFLLEIHGQHANQSLLKADGQRELLDRFAGLDSELLALRKAWRTWQDTAQQLTRAHEQGRELALEKDRLQWQLQDLDALNPQAQEWEQVSEEQKRLEHAQSLAQTSTSAAEQLSEGDASLVGALQRMSAKLTPLSSIDSRLLPITQLINDATIQLDEAARELAHYAQKSELNPQRAKAVEDRLSALFAVSRKHKTPSSELPALHARLREQLAQLEQAQDLAALEARSLAAQSSYQQLAKKLSAARKKAAVTLSKGISQTIQGLGMQGGQVSVNLLPQVAGPNGEEGIEFLVQAHGAGAARPLAKVASGGELSRVSLGIAVAAASANPTPTIIFDEADAGVGGAVAEKIGQLMRALGTDKQVLTVTHLPQVAALGHQHYVVSKLASKEGVRSAVNLLNRKQRVEEIARMLGGVDITSTTRKHATELLAKEGIKV